MSARGHLCIVLHAHLPFVRDPHKEWFLEEDWFFEAVAETYVPLILLIERLAKENIRPALTISLSPTLCAMLEDEVMAARCRRYLLKRYELAEEEISRLADDDPFLKAAVKYRDLFSQALEVFDRFSGDLITPFKQFQQNNWIEIITSSATHAVMPLLIHPEAVRAQISLAAADYQERFGCKPKGLWLPECAFEPRTAQYMKLAGFNYFFMENHGLAYANPAPRHGVYMPTRVRGGLCAFARDAESAKEVWSSKFGYPGDEAYREFYRDLGYDADYEYIKPYLHPDGVRRSIGLKYHKITGPVELAHKQPYDPDIAAETAMRHAQDFLKKRMAQVEKIYAEQNIRPVIVGTYDAELFGHWWFEGPQFLENVIRLIRQERLPLQMSTAGECCGHSNDTAEVEPEESSWGSGGYFDTWCNDKNDWIYPRVNFVTERMIELANRYQHQDLTHLDTRILNQAARETLLAQSSDWAFLLYVGSHSEFAKRQIAEHCDNFFTLAKMVAEKKPDERILHALEEKDNLFANMDFRVFASASTF